MVRSDVAPLALEPICQGPLMSLPALLGGSPQQAADFYLELNPQGRETRLPRKPRVGLVWASGQFLNGYVLEREYRRKSLLGAPLQSLLNAMAQRPVELVSLQHGPDRLAPPWLGCFAEVLPADADFLAMARLMQTLDLVISVDTAAAHLAGALGQSVWTLLPWAAASRWGRDSATTPWYKTMRLLRQPRHDDWYGLIQLVLARLDLWLADWH